MVYSYPCLKLHILPVLEALRLGTAHTLEVTCMLEVKMNLKEEDRGLYLRRRVMTLLVAVLNI